MASNTHDLSEFCLFFQMIFGFKLMVIGQNMMSSKVSNEEDSSTLNLPIWPLYGALYTSRRFGGRRWRQGKTSGNLGENNSF
jgi:hypothetical protein